MKSALCISGTLRISENFSSADKAQQPPWAANIIKTHFNTRGQLRHPDMSNVVENNLSLWPACLLELCNEEKREIQLCKRGGGAARGCPTASPNPPAQPYTHVGLSAPCRSGCSSPGATAGRRKGAKPQQKANQVPPKTFPKCIRRGALPFGSLVTLHGQQNDLEASRDKNHTEIFREGLT